MVIGDHINWKANDTPIRDSGFDYSDLPQIVNVSTNERIAKLKITGYNYINGTRITCHVSQLQEQLTPGVFRLTTDHSHPALIRVQGTTEYLHFNFLYYYYWPHNYRFVGSSD